MVTKFYIYKIINKVNGKLYFGKAKNIHKRWQKHLATDKGNKIRHQYIHRALNKYGIDSFIIKAVEACNTEKQAFKQEMYYIQKYNTFYGMGYNLTEGGEGSSGFKHTEEAKKKIVEGRRSYGGKENPFYGVKHSAEAKQLMSENGYRKQRYFSFKEAELMRRQYWQNKLETYKSIAKAYDSTSSTIKSIMNFRQGYINDNCISLWPKQDSRNRTSHYQQ